MRADCKHHQSRTYGGGEVARFCSIDLAPEAPWRCPENCVGFERRIGDAAFVYGSLADTQSGNSSRDFDLPDNVGDLLDNAEDVVNAVVPEALFERAIQLSKENAKQPLWRKIFKRK